MKYLLKRYPNWRSATETLPAVSTFLAGFSLNMMLLSLRPDTCSVNINILGRLLATYGIALTLLAIATLLFIYSVQCLLRARSYNYYDIKNELVEQIEREAKQMNGDLELFRIQMDNKCRAWYNWGSRLFNIAVIFLLAGSAALIYPYSVLVTVLFLLGIVTEVIWLVVDRL